MKLEFPDGMNADDFIRWAESQVGHEMPANLKSMLQEHSKPAKVTKTFAMREKWQPLWDALEKSRDEFKLAKAKRDSKHNLFWRTVEEDLKQYNFAMQYNEKTKEIEQLDETKSN